MCTYATPEMHIVLIAIPFLPNPKPADKTRTSFPELNTRHHANYALSKLGCVNLSQGHIQF